jgi:ABC-type Fe3+/spermidine/putrescine transport system ATPase subunit
LSGGQQQRVALARALVVQPRCLLLDEPLSNLDARLRHEMRAEIRRLCKSLGLTAIYVTHDRDEALSMADRVAIMDGGRLVQVGAPEEVYRHPGSAMVAEFLGDTNFIQGVAQGLSSREGYYAVQTHVGIMSARPNLADWNPAQGDPVILSVRPEAFSFGHILGASNSFTGHIIETTYLGASVQYLFQVYNGPVLKVSESNPQRIRQPSTEAVRVSVSAADAVMIQH